ncbi:hypothetical protein PO909_024508 [Leuciscus waleckii]
MPGKSRKAPDQALTSSILPPSLTSNVEETPEKDTPESDNSAILSVISSLRAELLSIKSDIGEIIDSKIEQNVTIRGELSTFKNEANAAISEIKVTVDDHAAKLTCLSNHASASSDTMVKMEQDLGKLKLTVEQLTEKCTDLESRSRRQNIRILNIKEGAEFGVKPRDFVAQLLAEALSLDKPPHVDRAHRALRARPGNDEPPRAFILQPLAETIRSNPCIHGFNTSNTVNKISLYADDILLYTTQPQFADDTTVIGLISKGDEAAYREEVLNMAAWCSENNLALNTKKTKEIIVNFRKNSTDLAPLYINGNITVVIKKAQQRLRFLRVLRKCNLASNLLLTFYRSSIESLLTNCITVWSTSDLFRKLVPAAAGIIAKSGLAMLRVNPWYFKLI